MPQSKRVTMELGLAVLLLCSFGLVHTEEIETTSTLICPQKFTAVGRKCYHFSTDEATWQDAHFICTSLTINATLAIVNNSKEELLMRRYLNRYSSGRHERWIGGIFNWKKSIWEWGETGKPLTFHAFSRMNARLTEKWKWHCIITDPERQNKWGAKNCVKKKRYICQTAGKKHVSTRLHRAKKNFKKEDCNGDRNEKCKGLVIAPGFLVKKPKRKFGHYPYNDFICPPHMILVGRKCYYFSTDLRHWNDAYWACRDNKTKLAVVSGKLQDNILRGFLNANFVEHHERWIGGMYDQKQKIWKWAMSGRPVKYQNFAEEIALDSKEHTYDCITMDPYYQHRWNARNRFELKHYICQVKPKTLMKKENFIRLKPPDATVVIELDNTITGVRAKKSTDMTTALSKYLNKSFATIAPDNVR